MITLSKLHALSAAGSASFVDTGRHTQGQDACRRTTILCISLAAASMTTQDHQRPENGYANGAPDSSGDSAASSNTSPKHYENDHHADSWMSHMLGKAS